MRSILSKKNIIIVLSVVSLAGLLFGIKVGFSRSILLVYVFKGGFMMWPLLACSLLAMAIILERFSYYHGLDTRNRFFLKALSAQLRESRVAGLAALCDQYATPLSLTLKAGINQLAHGKEAIRRAIEEESLVHTAALEKYLPFLHTIASVSTLMGFTGTVIGMIEAFQSIVREGVSSPTVVAAGIGQALITTAAGLLIAIPTVIFYQYFMYRVDKECRRIELYGIEITNIEITG